MINNAIIDNNANDNENYINQYLHDIKYDEYNELMNSLFSNLKFTADCYDYDRLDEILVKSNKATIKHRYTCYCVERREYENIEEIIEIENEDGEEITLFDFYNYCNEFWTYKVWEFCNHHFLECIDVKQDENGNYILEPWFGS